MTATRPKNCEPIPALASRIGRPFPTNFDDDESSATKPQKGKGVAEFGLPASPARDCHGGSNLAFTATTFRSSTTLDQGERGEVTPPSALDRPKNAGG